MLAGIQWAAGRTDGPTAPNPELSTLQETLAKKAAADAGVTEELLKAEAAEKAKSKEQAKTKVKAKAKAEK